MHIQMINFQLSGVTEAEYVALCDELAPAFAAVPGLVRKVWLANSETCLIPSRITRLSPISLPEISECSRGRHR
jgi:hypothetical protein